MKSSMTLQTKKILLTVCFIMLSVLTSAQSTNFFDGSWTTPKNTTVKVETVNKVQVGKQADAKTDKEKANNGKVVIKDIKVLSKYKFSALIVDPSSNKEYKSEFLVADDRKSLTLTVKWGVFSHEEKWTAKK